MEKSCFTCDRRSVCVTFTTIVKTLPFDTQALDYEENYKKVFIAIGNVCMAHKVFPIELGRDIKQRRSSESVTD